MADTIKDPDEAMDAVDTTDTSGMDAQQSTPPTATAEPDEQGLNLSDIRACVTIIDIVTKRGAFEGAELADVGSVRNRLDNFLKAAAEAQNPAEETKEDEVKV
jgi:hypothetical protein